MILHDLGSENSNPSDQCHNYRIVLGHWTLSNDKLRSLESQTHIPVCSNELCRPYMIMATIQNGAVCGVSNDWVGFDSIDVKFEAVS